MSPLFAALPPADLPAMAYVAPTGIHVMATDHSHTVRDGDTVHDIAERYGVSPENVVRANSLPQGGRWIMAGTVLRIPAGSGSGPSAAPAPSSAATSTAATYTVRAGDTLSGIAARHGVTVRALADASGISSSTFIHPGQQLRLPAPGSTASRSQTRTNSPTELSRPYDESNIGDRHEGQQVEDTFLHYRYSSGTTRSAAANREYLASVDVPSRDAVKKMISDMAERHGVDPQLALALSYQESGWNHRAVSPANAIGAMQVIPTSGQWASSLVGRELNLLDTQDNVTAGVVILRTLLRSADSTDHAIGGYYQGLASVRQHGLFSDTEQYVRNIRSFMQTL